MKRQNLGDILLGMGAIDRLQLQSALAHQRQWGTPLGRALVQNRLCSEAKVLEALARQCNLPTVDLDAVKLDFELAHLISQKVAEQHRVVPLKLEGARKEVIVVAIAAPASLAALDAVRSVSRKLRVVPLLAGDDAIERAIGKLYRGYAEAETEAASPRNEAIRFDEPEFDFAPPVEPVINRIPERPVLLYGWTDEAARALGVILSAESIPARAVGAIEVLRCAPEDTVFAPLLSISALLPDGQRFHARLVVAGKSPEADLPKAHEVGARGFVIAPLDPALFVRAIRRCRQLATQPQAAA